MRLSNKMKQLLTCTATWMYLSTMLGRETRLKRTCHMIPLIQNSGNKDLTGSKKSRAVVALEAGWGWSDWKWGTREPFGGTGDVLQCNDVYLKCILKTQMVQLQWVHFISCKLPSIKITHTYIHTPVQCFFQGS